MHGNVTNLNTYIQTWTLMLQECEQNAAAVLTLTMCGIIYCMSLVLRSHSTTPPEFHITQPLSLHTKSSAARLPLQACLLFTDTCATLTCCEELPTATLTISKSNWVREIHFGFFLFSRCCVRQLLWWWDTKTALAANVHMSGKSSEVVFESVCVCACVCA